MKQGHMATDRYLVLEILAWFYGIDPLHKAPRTDVCGSGALMRILDVLIPVFTFQGMEREQRRVGLHKL